MSVDSVNDYIQRCLPSIRSIGVTVQSADEKAVVLTAPLELNDNGRGCAFGASLYSIAMASCWATMYMACEQRFGNPNIVARDGQIRYRRPCKEAVITATCRNPNPRQWDGFFAHYEKAGQTTLSLTSKIQDGDEIAAYFDGVFVLLGED